MHPWALKTFLVSFPAFLLTGSGLVVLVVAVIQIGLNIDVEQTLSDEAA
jgi:hypothetical protein